MDSILFSDEYFMRIALKQAEGALADNEVPIGAIVVIENEIIAKAYNQCERLHDSTAHAEMLALTAASNHLNSKYLEACKLYVTLEPCIMCAGAIGHSRIGTLIYGASDLKAGFSNYTPSPLHKNTRTLSGIEENECAKVLSDFFKQKRFKH